MSGMSSKEPSDFKKIEFGKADAANEADLLVEGFLDTQGYIDKIISGKKYFVIGQKGSGKTAIATRMKILSDKQQDIVAILQMLEDFDYDGFGGVIPKKEAPEVQYGNTWEFLLALKLIESYAEGKVELDDRRSDPNELVKALRKLGILPNDLRSIVRLFKNKEFKVDAKVAEYTASSRRLENEDIRKLIGSVSSAVYDIHPSK